MLPKFKVFSWGICYYILPTYNNIARIRQEFLTTCPRCNSCKETLIHAMKDCPKVREILMIDGLNNRLIDGRYERCIDWLEDILRVLDKKATVDFFTLLWNCWNDRNNLVFQGKKDTAMVVWEKVQTFSKDFRIFNLAEPSVIPSIPMSKVVDGNVRYGAIARDHDGFVIGGSYSFVNKIQNMKWAEFDAFVEGLNLALKLKVDKLILESDSAFLVNATKKRDQDITILGCSIKKASRMFRNFTSVQVNWIGRCSNRAADFLCILAIKEKCNSYFNMDFPMEIHSIVINDAIN
ncbi:uncharacterized protein LOC108472096 [Gossypium arboreum]|uniref:uncharacterized protein LOC108472096 n=1 Tax=Gossypium arboreum TaxID=29729 RepID=UPI00081977BC|nr:uncharacterized protein LOC108472096 [Gossypium arboreum]